MRVYCDLCCLERPFDSQEQPLVRLEAEAVLTILSLERAGRLRVRVISPITLLQEIA